MDAIRIALIDDQKLFRQTMGLFISQTPGFRLLIEAHNGNDFLAKLTNSEYLPHIALVDMEMPVMDGIELNGKLQTMYPEIKVIILSIHAKERLIANMIHAGASGYLVKNCDKEELIAAIRTTHNNGFYINEQVLKAMQNASGKQDAIKNISGIAVEISAREKEILQLICQEYSNTEIAEKLFISPRTAEGHRNNLLAKTGCRNTAGLVVFAVKSHIYKIL